MGEFSDFVGKRRAEQEAADEKARRHQEWLDGVRSENEARLERILHVGPILSRALVAKEVSPDMIVQTENWEYVRRGLKKHYESVPKPIARGWSATQSIAVASDWGMAGARHGLNGIMLATDGQVHCYATVTRDYDPDQPGKLIDDVRVGDVLGTHGADSVVDRSVDTSSVEPKVGYLHLGTFRLTEIESGLANLVIKHDIDPDIF